MRADAVYNYPEYAHPSQPNRAAPRSNLRQEGTLSGVYQVHTRSARLESSNTICEGWPDLVLIPTHGLPVGAVAGVQPSALAIPQSGREIRNHTVEFSYYKRVHIGRFTGARALYRAAPCLSGRASH